MSGTLWYLRMRSVGDASPTVPIPPPRGANGAPPPVPNRGDALPPEEQLDAEVGAISPAPAPSPPAAPPTLKEPVPLRENLLETGGPLATLKDAAGKPVLRPSDVPASGDAPRTNPGEREITRPGKAPIRDTGRYVGRDGAKTSQRQVLGSDAHDALLKLWPAVTRDFPLVDGRSLVKTKEGPSVLGGPTRQSSVLMTRAAARTTGAGSVGATFSWDLVRREGASVTLHLVNAQVAKGTSGPGVTYTQMDPKVPMQALIFYEEGTEKGLEDPAALFSVILPF